jgi:hypothetical protein
MFSLLDADFGSALPATNLRNLSGQERRSKPEPAQVLEWLPG